MARKKSKKSVVKPDKVVIMGKPTTYDVHGVDEPITPELVLEDTDITKLANKLHSKINVDPSRFNRREIQAMAKEPMEKGGQETIGAFMFRTLFNSDEDVLTQNRLNNKNLLAGHKDPEKEAERIIFRSYRSNWDRLTKALFAKDYKVLQVSGDSLRDNDQKWIRRTLRQVYRPEAVRKMAIERELELDWEILSQLSREKNKLGAIEQALSDMSTNGYKNMDTRAVKFLVKDKVLSIQQKRDREAERKRRERRDETVKMFAHQVKRTHAQRDVIDLGLRKTAEQFSEITEALSGNHSIADEPTETVSSKPWRVVKKFLEKYLNIPKDMSRAELQKAIDTAGAWAHEDQPPRTSHGEVITEFLREAGYRTSDYINNTDLQEAIDLVMGIEEEPEPEPTHRGTASAT